jgi:hypothetical protein
MRNSNIYNRGNSLSSTKPVITKGGVRGRIVRNGVFKANAYKESYASAELRLVGSAMWTSNVTQ